MKNVLSYDTHYDQGIESNMMVIRCPRDLDASAHADLKELMEQALESGHRHFELDLTNVRFISSSGIGCILAIHKLAIKNKATLTVTGMNPKIRDALNRVQLDQIIQVRESGSFPEVEYYDDLYDLMLSEYEMLARLNQLFKKIQSAKTVDGIPALIMKSLSRHLRCPIALVLKPLKNREGMLVECNSGLSLDRLQRFEKRLPEDCTITADFPKVKEACDLKTLWLLEQWPDILKDIAGKNKVLVLPLHEKSRLSALLFFVMPLRNSLQLDNILHILQTYAGLCGLMLERHRLLRETQAKNRQLQNALHKLETTQQSLIEVGKLANLGVIISSLAHHFNNRLVPIVGYSQILRARHRDLDPCVVEKIAKIEQSALEVQKILDSLIGMSRQQNLRLESCSLTRLVKTILSVCEYEIENRHIKTDINFDDRMPKITLDRELIEQALLVLFQNALDQLEHEENPELSIKTEWTNERAIFEITNNGRRINQDEEDILLDPFGTMRKPEDMKVMNLLVVSQIVRAHHGMVEIATNNGVSTLRLSLMRSPSSSFD